MADNQKIWDRHPELFHYTDQGGLKGILDSGHLHAGKISELNDASELELMKDRLISQLEPFFLDQARTRYRAAKFSVKRKIGKLGGVVHVAHAEAERYVGAYFETAFPQKDQKSPREVPFTTSFCAHTDDQDYERKHGLLSQWRGYGGKGGFAIVFDTRKLWDLCENENQRFSYRCMSLGDIVYDGQDEFFLQEFGPTIEATKGAYLKLSQTGQIEVAKFMHKIIAMFARLKHRAFFEEREVRIIAAPMTKQLEEFFDVADSDYDELGKELRTVSQKKDGSQYLRLFEFENDGQLPIKRIIVGPQRDQRQAVAAVKSLVGKRQIRVDRSETPWLP